MKKNFGLALLALLSVGMVACGGNTDKTSNGSQDVAPTVDAKLQISVTGKLTVGETITFVAKYDGSPVAPQTDVKYTADAAAMDITGNKAVLKLAGEQTVKATYVTSAGATAYNEFKFTVEEAAKPTPIAEVKKLAVEGKYTPVLVRGVVQATSGTSAFIADNTDGIYMYNWYFANTDTASVKNYSWVVGMSVEVYAYVTEYYGAAQLCGSYKEGSGYHDLEGKYAIKLDEEVEAIAPQKITEEDLKTFTTKGNAGRMYTFDAEYVSGKITASATVKEYVKFKVGSTQIEMMTDGSSKKVFDKKLKELAASFTALNLQAGDKVTITAPYSQYFKGETHDFCWYSSGVTVVKK